MLATRRTLHRLCAACCALACCWAAWHAVRAGASRLLSESVPRLASTEYESEAPALAEGAWRLSPSDPEAAYALAVVAAQRDDDTAAVAALERAVALRPGYYLTWLKLGRARERAGDMDGALAALNETIRLAPTYAEPHWQRGNTLLRAGALDEAFAELRLASASRPALFAYTVDLAWHTHNGDAREVMRATAPRNASERITLARFLVKRGAAAEALVLYRTSDDGVGVNADERRALVADMIAANKFQEASAVWADKHHADVGGGRDGEATTKEKAGGSVIATGRPQTSIFNGGFESPTGSDEPGFDWRFARDARAINFTLDGTTPHGGARSLLLSFDGVSETGARLVSQLVPVEPGARYRLSFAARTEALVSGGMPFVALMNAAGDRALAQSEPLPRDTVAWRAFTLEFTAPDGAALIVVKRLSCPQPTCPIFGRAWFDDFSLEKLSTRN